MVVPGSLFQYKAHHPFGVPNSVVYSYLTDGYRDKSAASVLGGRIPEAGYFTMSYGAFSRAVQYGPASRLEHEQIMIACEGRDALLQVRWVLIGQWFRYKKSSFLKDMDVDPR